MSGGWRRLPDDVEELEAALREWNAREIAAFLDDLRSQLRLAFGNLPADELEDALKRSEALARCHGDACVRQIVRQRLH